MTATPLQINFITADQCLDLRSRILRPGQALNLCQFPEDNFDSTFHVGLTIDQRIVANGTFMKNQCEKISNATNPYRLRGMATDPEFHKKGYGSKIIIFAEAHLKNLKCDLLWFNAREAAFMFYEKNGFSYASDMFDIAGVGPHKVMYKWL